MADLVSPHYDAEVEVFVDIPAPIEAEIKASLFKSRIVRFKWLSVNIVREDSAEGER